MNKLYTILFISTFLRIAVYGQKTDTSVVISAVKIDPYTILSRDADIDTSLFNTQFYNPAFRNDISVTFIGNTGQAFISNYFFNRLNSQPFIFHSAFVNYFHDPYNTLLYNTRKPFTELKYMSSGSRATSEQVLNVIHTQNVSQYTNFGINYDAISSRGIYLKQDSRANLLSISGSYKKEKYSMNTSFHTNKLSYNENGGLTNIDDFLEHQINDPLAYNINLSDASSMVKKTTFFLTHTYSNIPASTDTTENYYSFLPKGSAITHLSNYTRFLRTYTDNIPEGDEVNFYSNNYYLINSVHDSAFMHSLENLLFLSLKDKKERFILLSGVRHQFQEFSTLTPFTTPVTVNDILLDTIVGRITKKSYNNLSITGNIVFNTRKFKTFINAEYFLSGFRQNDISIHGLMNKTFGEGIIALGLGGAFDLVEPDFFLRSYSSSHFRWSNEFGKTLNANVSIWAESKNGMIYAEGRSGIVNNFVFFNESALPEIREKNLYISSVRLKTTFRWGGFNHVHNFLLQKASDNESVNLPLFAYRNSTYFEQSLFKDALILQAGFNFMYNTLYYSDTYMPATGVFYMQNIMKTGNYPFLDGFLNWQIKRTRFFLKYTNVLAGLAGYNYFTSYGYPMNERSLKFGLAWTFYD